MTHAGTGRAFVKRAERYLCTLWKLFGRAMQQHRSLVGQVHVDAVGGEVVGHGQFVIAVVAHLLHDLHRENGNRQEIVPCTTNRGSRGEDGMTRDTGALYVYEQNLWGRTP